MFVGVVALRYQHGKVFCGHHTTLCSVGNAEQEFLLTPDVEDGFRELAFDCDCLAAKG